MEKIHPTNQQTEKQLLALIRRSMMICDPHAAMQRKSNFNIERYRITVMSKNQAAWRSHRYSYLILHWLQWLPSVLCCSLPAT